MDEVFNTQTRMKVLSSQELEEEAKQETRPASSSTVAYRLIETNQDLVRLACVILLAMLLGFWIGRIATTWKITNLPSLDEIHKIALSVQDFIETLVILCVGVYTTWKKIYTPPGEFTRSLISRAGVSISPQQSKKKIKFGRTVSPED